ncbi:MAG: hypothetical protein RLZZ502_1926 [Pseudomonadota bacterium]|jgi:Fe-S-cluster containining protein
MSNPCLNCGACCSTFKVSFYWAEADDVEGGKVPAALTNQCHLMSRCMKGTDASAPRCIALTGIVGDEVACSVYELRPSPCRTFNFHGENGMPNPRCNEARAKHGLPSIEF